jgi:hypothetical protein
LSIFLLKNLNLCFIWLKENNKVSCNSTPYFTFLIGDLQ